MLQIVASLIDAARGVIYDRHMFIAQATDDTNNKQYLRTCYILQIYWTKTRHHLKGWLQALTENVRLR